MDPQEISRFSKYLRQKCDKVLNSNFKLTLSGYLLRALNDSFSLIADENEIYAPQTFQVVKPNNSKSDAFRDLQFIHDFVQKTTILRLTNFQNDDFDGVVDLSKFRSLRVLEIHRISIQRIVGIQRMRPYLTEIICNRSIESVQDIISHCGGDNCIGFCWENLNAADFSYNLLTTIDSSLEFAPSLQHLNLSHNKLVSVDAIKWLPNLKIVHLEFNQLKYIPRFHNEASRRLQTLILTSNYLGDISGVSSLDALSVLDVSGNCILDHSSLLPLTSLINLSFLNLNGNPLAFHPHHRQMTAQCLHRNTSSVKFVLDMQPLSKSEKTMTGSKPMVSRLMGGSSGLSTPTRITDRQTPSSSLGSSSIDLNDGDKIVAKPLQTKIKKRRPVEIPDMNDECDKEKVVKDFALEGNKDHLETKKQIESLRKQYGDGWLAANQGASMVHEVLGIKNEIEKPYSPDEIEILLSEEIQVATPKAAECLYSSTPNKSGTPNADSSDSIIDCEKTTEENSAYESVNDTTQKSSTTAYETAPDVDILSDIYRQEPSVSTEPVVSDAEDNQVTYIVYVEPSNIQMFLVVSDISMKEKDASTGRTKTRWTLKTMESCDRIKSDVLRINFDTIRKDKKERIYRVDEGLCQKLEQYLRGILAKRPLSEMNQSIYSCPFCRTQFSRENYKNQNVDVTCPDCHSSYLINIKESPRAQSIERVGQYLRQNLNFMDKRIENSESQSSIEIVATNVGMQVLIPVYSTAWRRASINATRSSATSLNESSSCSKISKSQSSFDSNQSVAGSSNCDREADFNKNGDSDIEILSNPSQSSIAIIDSIQSSRKHSEERRLSELEGLDLTATEYIENLQLLSCVPQTVLVNQQTSTLDLNVDTANSNTEDGAEPERKTVLSAVHLTESSSSGSVTDGSICTAYEQGHGEATNSEVSSNKTTSPVNEKFQRNDSVLSTMLGGLFQSTNFLMSKTVKDAATMACDKFKFYYTDFSNVDHRFKLFLYQNIFEDAGEQLKWLVKGKIFNENNGPGTDIPTIIDGVFVMSTTKFYVLQIVGNESEEILKWIKRRTSGTVDRIETVRVLPWKIGVTLTIKGIGVIHLLLRDIARTDSLLLFFANNPLPMYCTLEYQISERLSQKLLKTTENAQLKMLTILDNCEASIDDKTISSLALVGLIITEADLYLTCPSHQWLSDKCDADILTLRKQFMNNLVEVEKVDGVTLKINFLHENTDKCELWTCSFITETCMDSTINAISISWEKLFGVPLLANN